MAEKKQIKISVKDKIACLVDEEQFLVCGNNDYEVVFDFDSDWDGISAKTAVFVYGDTPVHQPFTDNICKGIEIKNSTLCAIGVFAGDIKTTTGATIECRQSIRDIGGVPKPPSKEVYDEIMALLDKAIEAHTELPVGGQQGQVLRKKSDKDYDTHWSDDYSEEQIDKLLENKQDLLPINDGSSSHRMYVAAPKGFKDADGNEIKYYLKRLNANKGNQGIVTKYNRDQKLAEGLITKAEYENTVDRDEPTMWSIGIRTTTGEFIAEDGTQPFCVVNKRQLDGLKMEIEAKIGNVEEQLNVLNEGGLV